MQKKSTPTKESDSKGSVIYVINVESTPPTNVPKSSSVALTGASDTITVIPIESAITDVSRAASTSSADDGSTSADDTKITEADSNSSQLSFGDDDESSRQRQLDDKYGG